MQKSTEARTQMAIATPFSLPAAPLHRFWSHKHEVRWPALPQVWRWNWCFNTDISTTYIKLWIVYWHCLCSPRRREGNRRRQWWGRSTSGPGHHLKQINDSSTPQAMCRDVSIIFTVRCHLEAELVLVDGAGAGLLSHLGAVLASACAGVALETGCNSS